MQTKAIFAMAGDFALRSDFPHLAVLVLVSIFLNISLYFPNILVPFDIPTRASRICIDHHASCCGCAVGWVGRWQLARRHDAFLGRFKEFLL
jgi:hypothetical protein